jgi:signal transduction histidine kinase
VKRKARIVIPLRVALVGSHLAVLALPWLALVGTGALGWDLVHQTRTELTHQATILGVLVRDELAEARDRDPKATVHALGLSQRLEEIRTQTLASIRLLDAQGIVVASSGDELGEDLSGRREVIDALNGLPATVLRPRDPPSRGNSLTGPSRRARVRVFTARPVVMGDELVGVLLLSRTPREEVQALVQMAPRLAWGVLLGLALTVLFSVYLGYRFSRSLRVLAQTSHRIADGEMHAVEALELASRSHLAEVRELSTAVATMTARLRERLAYITEFAGNVSHEFKTPISTLRGTVELLRDDKDMPAEQRERFLDNAQADLERMERLVSGLLALARAEEAGGQETLALQDVVQSAVRRHPSTVLEGCCGPVLGVPEQLESLLHNLVDNAWRHGGPEVSVAAVCWRDEDWTGVNVIDDGPGISAANQALVFQRFFTTDRESGGTGLGLALAKAVCRSHGGTIQMESRPGRTCFSVVLPLARGEG